MKYSKIILQTKIRILEATVITEVTYSSEAWAKDGGGFSRCFPEKQPMDFLGYLTN